MSLARLGAFLNIFFLISISRATYTLFASTNPSDIKSDKFISINRVPAKMKSNKRQVQRNTRNKKGFSYVGKNECTALRTNVSTQYLRSITYYIHIAKLTYRRELILGLGEIDNMT